VELVPRWRFALMWLLTTSLGWVAAFGAMWAMCGRSGIALEYGTANGDSIGWALAMLPFVGIPIVAYAQCLGMGLLAPSEPRIYWLGVPVCSFPVAFVGAFLLWRPEADYLGCMSIPPIPRTFWLLRAFWGIATWWVI